MPAKKPDIEKFMERRAKTIAKGAISLIKPALGDALMEVLQAGIEPSRAALVAVLEAKFKKCPSIIGDSPREQDLLRLTLEQTLAVLQPQPKTTKPPTK
jgi:hypothetical protein